MLVGWARMSSIGSHIFIAASFLVLAAPAAAKNEAVNACFNLISSSETRQCLKELYRTASAKLDGRLLSAFERGSKEATDACFDLISNSETRQCLEDLYRNASAKLDGAFLAAIERASGADGTLDLATSIRKSQSLWQAYRDAECLGVVGHGARPSLPWKWRCLAEKTLQRIEDLEGER